MRRMFSLKQLQEIADSEVKSLVEGGTLSNAKPIYCHPIVIEQQDNPNFKLALCMLLFDNNPNSYTPNNYDPTILISHLKEFSAGARIILTGSVYDITNSLNVVATQLYFNGTNLIICGIDDNGTYHTAEVSPLNLETIGIAYCADVVNKIN